MTNTLIMVLFCLGVVVTVGTMVCLATIKYNGLKKRPNGNILDEFTHDNEEHTLDEMIEYHTNKNEQAIDYQITTQENNQVDEKNNNQELSM